MSAHGWYVVAAYGVSVLVLGGLIIGLLMDASARRRELAALEASGLRRRSEKREPAA